MIAFADVLLLVIGMYFALGICFALAFALWGAQTIDPAAKGMSPLARVLILPGATALWPLLLLKWWRRQLPPAA